VNWTTIKSALTSWPIIVVAITIACLVPFAGKAFHIDDPLFIWSAKQINVNPADFYGFKVNWYTMAMPMAEVTKNPPATCYYIALVGWLFGWSEIVLHISFLVPAAAAALGIFYLARQFCSRPGLATLAAVLTPAFLVSGTNVMCDTMMLALWVWAVFFWVRGIKQNNKLELFIGALLVAACALTKYFGIALLGLLSVYSLIQNRGLGYWVLFLLIPVIILAGYQWATQTLYGRGLLLDAASFATNFRWRGSTELLLKGLTGLAFMGGCVITALFYWPLLWTRRFTVAGILLTILSIRAFILLTGGGSAFNEGYRARWVFFVQASILVAGGLSLLGLAAADYRQCRDADSLLLVLWVLGTFVFAGFINWVVNARSILPIVPAVGILLMRRIDRRIVPVQGKGIWRLSWPLVPAAVLSLLVCWADYTLAGTARDAADAIHKEFASRPGNVWFKGHWGFQYYMEANGYKAFDYTNLKPVSGNVVVVPSNNYGVMWEPPIQKPHMETTFRFEPCSWLSTMSRSLGAGFYADIWGPLPFVIGPVAPEEYYILFY